MFQSRGYSTTPFLLYQLLVVRPFGHIHLLDQQGDSRMPTGRDNLIEPNHSGVRHHSIPSYAASASHSSNWLTTSCTKLTYPFPALPPLAPRCLLPSTPSQQVLNAKLPISGAPRLCSTLREVHLMSAQNTRPQSGQLLSMIAPVKPWPH